ncbi:MAG: hypothetical protein QF767_05740 [Alphaproteobacteria bacterium]|nr:hypothetical protein [Alphaproteobacteria bacterium]
MSGGERPTVRRCGRAARAVDTLIAEIAKSGNGRQIFGESGVDALLARGEILPRHPDLRVAGEQLHHFILKRLRTRLSLNCKNRCRAEKRNGERSNADAFFHG